MSIETLNMMFYVFLVLTIMFFLISVLLFFVFDIKKIYLILSGKAEKLGIKKLQEESFRTGNLSKNNSANSVYNDTDSFAESEKFGTSGKVQVLNDMAGTNQTTILGGEETTMLGVEETTVLGVGETTMLGGETDMLGTAQTTILKNDRKFVIIKKNVLIHTEEVI